MVSTVALATGAILDQGCSSLGELPKGMVWYKAGASAWQTEYDWNMCQLQELHVTSPQPLTTASQANFTTPNYPPTTVQPDAYGLGVNSDQYGRATTYQLQNGQQLDPIFNGSVKQNAYGPGVGMDQFGRPIYNAPYVDTGRQPTYNAPNDNSVGGQIALNLLVEMTQNHRAKTAMIAKGYALVNKDEMSKSFQNLKVKAEGGNADAEYRLSLCYANNYASSAEFMGRSIGFRQAS